MRMDGNRKMKKFAWLILLIEFACLCSIAYFGLISGLFGVR